jgi:GTP-binding protein Era
MNILPEEMTDFKSGIVTLVGRPNVGKSTLINSLMKTKVTIVSDKPQTTRDRISCIYNEPDLQIVFTDTPGIHIPKHKLGETLVERARNSMEDADVVCYLVESTDRRIGDEDRIILEYLSKVRVPLILVVTKSDMVRNRLSDLEKVKDLYSAEIDFLHMAVLSARERENLDDFISLLSSLLPFGYPYYPEDILIDRSEKFLASELIREQILSLTHREVPHSIAVKIEEYKSPLEYPERKDVYIRADIYVERPGQKAIVIGENGRQIKEIGRRSRRGIEKMTGFKVYLDLWIKVRPKWRRSERDLKRMGFGRDS